MSRGIARRAAVICCLAAPISYAQASPAWPADDSRGAAVGVQILSSSQMQQGDARLLEARQVDVAQAAELYGYDVASGTWLQNQVICPDATGYLLMHYLKIAQDGGVSLFTAVVPHAEGRVKIVPVLYHGTQALRVLGSSPEQRAWINEVVSTKKIAGGPRPEDDWASLAFCYAALGGAEPTSTSVTSPEETKPTLVLSPEGKVREMSFGVVGADHLFQNWTVFFDKEARVTSIAMLASAVRPPRTAPEVKSRTRAVAKSSESKTQVIPDSQELKTHVIPSGPELKTHVIPNSPELKTHVIPNSP